ncbi:related to mitochondrial hypoxia responsive domain protein [Cephalotrichum gorgonifer]|uniref:Related to mitochondrial hypoxia responsive domain protein n=1 Tax=Cephalotrichum gorgonifer TaxID=2041049 RepID=A0AAE8N031_9PEZI|nr:related to mitochondrial hypoxia responsive domain protein [Cephalotrichum gorgonifer]
MKVLTKEEEADHYNAVLKGGSIGGVIGLSAGIAGVALASRRYPSFAHLTLPFKSFLATSAGTFGLIIAADRASMAYQKAHNPMYGYRDEASYMMEQVRAQQTTSERFMTWGRENRYSIVFSSWLASMAASFAIVNRAKYLTGAQKLVQARVYAQGLTVAVLIITAVFEMNDAKKGSGRWQTVFVVDPNDPEHKKLIEKKIHKEEYEGQDLWKDMVAAEERRIAERKNQEAPEK